MKGMWMVARREILVRGTSKAYLIGVVASTLLVVLLSLLPNLLGGESTYRIGVVGAGAAELVEVLPAAGDASELDIETEEFADEAAARDSLVEDDIDIVVIDNEKLLADGDVNPELTAVLNGVHQSLVSQQQLAEAGLDVAAVNQALTVAPLVTEQVSGDDIGARIGIAYVLVIVLFMMVMMPTMYVATGVVEEKSSRIVEILLSTLKSWQMLTGKIVGLGLLGFVNLAIPVAVGLGVGTATGTVSALPDGLTATIGTSLIWWVLGFGFFAAMAGSLASLISRQEDMNSAIGPMTMLMVVSYLIASIYVWDPTATVARVFSFIPPVSMFLMPIRDAVGDAPMWQQAASAGLLALAMIGMFWLGATIYRRSVMRTGSKLKLTDVMRSH